MKTIYWAAPLFTQAERRWNRECSGILNGMGYSVLLPQDEATRLTENGVLNIPLLVNVCSYQAITADIVVAILDGADADSGTSVEVGLRLGFRQASSRPPQIIGVRTDFRDSEDGKLNAMFRLIDFMVYQASTDENVESLCKKIHEIASSPEFEQ